MLVLLKASSVFRRLLVGSAVALRLLRSGVAAATAAASGVPAAVGLFVGARGGDGNVAVVGGRLDAALAGFLEDQHGGAALQAGIAALTGPVPVAGFA